MTIDEIYIERANFWEERAKRWEVTEEYVRASPEVTAARLQVHAANRDELARIAEANARGALGWREREETATAARRAAGAAAHAALEAATYLKKWRVHQSLMPPMVGEVAL